MLQYAINIAIRLNNGDICDLLSLALEVVPLSGALNYRVLALHRSPRDPQSRNYWARYYRIQTASYAQTDRRRHRLEVLVPGLSRGRPGRPRSGCKAWASLLTAPDQARTKNNRAAT